MDAAVAAFLSELDGIFALKEDQRTALMAFLSGDVSVLPLTGFGKSFGKRWCSAARQRTVTHISPRGSLKLLTDSKEKKT